MKVLMLGWELPPYNSGGLGVACYELCESMARRDIAIEFVLPYHEDHETPFMTVTATQKLSASAFSQAVGAYDSHLYHYDEDVAPSDIYHQQKQYENAVAKLVDEREYDIVHAHDWLTFRAGLRAKQAKNVPLVLHVHSIERDRAGGNNGNPLVREVEATSLQLADSIVAVSQLTKQAIIDEYGIPAGKIEVVHNSIETKSCEPDDMGDSYPYVTALRAQGYKVVTSIGRLTVQKGLPNLLRAAKLVIDRQPKTLFLIVGSGEQYHELVGLSAELGIARNVLFAGFQRGQAWRDAFATADLFVMPSLSEPFGLTPLEAIGFGTPALVSKQSGVSEVLQNCLKVDAWDIHAMADQMCAVLREPALHDQLLVSAQDEISRLSWSQSVDKLLTLYGQHLGEVQKA